MRELIGPRWLKNTVTEREANSFNPELGVPCCDLEGFRVHLAGTPHNAWNKSAIDVFVGGFLATHPEYNANDEAVREMVRMKSGVYLESTIKEYRRTNKHLTDDEEKEFRKHKNRQERKRKASPPAL